MKEIPRFPDYYADEMGSIYSAKYGTLRELSRTPRDDGYVHVVLRRDNKSFNFLLHQLILLTFIGPCPRGMECCHINGDKSDCRLENLHWETSSKNAKDRVKHGSYNYPGRKLTEYDVEEIKESKGKATVHEVSKKYIS